MAGYIEDRWLNKRPDPATGKGDRYKVAGIPGVRARTFQTLDDAKAWLAKASSQAREGEFVDPRRGLITLSEYIDKYWLPGKPQRGKNRKNINERLNHIRPQLGALPLRDVTAAVLRKFIVHLEETVAGSYGNSICSTLASILDTAVEDKRITSNSARSKSVVFPSKKVKEKREAWAPEVVRAVLEAINPRHRIAVVLGAGCGLRQGEVFGLSAADIDFKDAQIHVHRQIQLDGNTMLYKLPKGEKTRVVPMPASVAAELRRHMREYAPLLIELPWGEADAEKTQQHALVLTNAAGNANNFKNWNVRTWKPALVAASLIPKPEPGARRGAFTESRKDGFHVLRHTYASVTLREEEDIVTLSHWLGHETPTITLEHYAHFMPQSGAKGAAAVNALLAPPTAAKTPLVLKLPQHSPALIWKQYPDKEPAARRHTKVGRSEPPPSWLGPSQVPRAENHLPKAS
ncbi:site-specific integrase [Streptomyces sp. NPDC094034]|uniref:tyrosine-type recombinase/integrase n=1 Tax=Streptomyces sp. NPDC094034 TaxID=3155309 RepID=UPI00331C410C